MTKVARHFCWLLLTIVAPGCGTGAYNEAFNVKLADVVKKASMPQLFAGTTDVKSGETVTGKIQLPQLFAGPTALTAATAGGQPPFLALPGYGYAFSQAVDAAGTPATVYVYFAGAEVASNPVDQLKTNLQAELGKASLSGSWEDVSLATPSGTTLAASRLRVVGQQMFGGAQADGQFDLYLVSTPTHHVLIGWRAPKTAVDALSFPVAAEISMGSFTPAG